MKLTDRANSTSATSVAQREWFARYQITLALRNAK